MAAQYPSFDVDDEKEAQIRKQYEEISARLLNLSTIDYLRKTTYHVTEFWREIPCSPCTILNGEKIRDAFRDLCRLLSLSTKPSYKHKILNLACLLATQLRSPENHQSLLVDQDKFQATFTMKQTISMEDYLITAEDEENLAVPRGEIMDFILSVEKMDPEMASIFCPVFACVVISIKKCSGRTAANTLWFVKNNFDKFYPHTKITVSLPSKEVLIDIFDRARETDYTYYHLIKNTLFLGCMYAYHKQDLTAATKEILDVLVLKSLRFKSMQLLTLLDEVTKAYGCSVDEYRQFVDGNAAKLSWRAYDHFMAEHGFDSKPVEGGEEDSFWMYAREFDHLVFQELAYNNNMWLCNISADLLDLKLHPEKVKAWPVLGPKYQNLTKYKRSKPGNFYYKEHHEYAVKVHRVLSALPSDAELLA